MSHYSGCIYSSAGDPRNDCKDVIERAILLRYNEIALKGGNRRWFEERLAINTRKSLKIAHGDSAPVSVSCNYGRILIKAPWDEKTKEALNRVFGISSISPMRTVATDLESIKAVALEEFTRHVESFGLPKTFKVKTRRSDKVIPLSSMEIDREIGTHLQLTYPQVAVDLKSPQFTLGVEIHAQETFIWTDKIWGRGGLPVGSNGRVLSLISGGLDSPVAAIQIIRRGAPASFVHFYGTPFVGEEVLEKVEDLVRLVNRFQPEPEPLYIVPFGKIQEKIALVTAPKMRTVLYRRMMMRIATSIAHTIKANALITGESLGQVASQTVENLIQTNEVTDLPVFRPLIASDKDEIITAAKSWGTYETSIRPGVDCCTLFADRHPVIRADSDRIQEQESKFSVSDLLQEGLGATIKKRVL